jgi:hypothetical protein
MHVGFDIAFEQPVALYDKPIDAVVSVKLTNGDGTTLFFDERQLRLWSWGRWSTQELDAFVWLDDRRINLREGGPYVLSIAVTAPDSGNRNYVARTAMKGGGWKAEW